jgi:hypothetical protein
VLTAEVVGEFTCCDGDNALPDEAATAAKGEVVAFANDPNVGTEVVAFFSVSLLESLVDAKPVVDLNPPKPELLLPKPPNVGCYIMTRY